MRGLGGVIPGERLDGALAALAALLGQEPQVAVARGLELRRRGRREASGPARWMAPLTTRTPLPAAHRASRPRKPTPAWHVAGMGRRHAARGGAVPVERTLRCDMAAPVPGGRRKDRGRRAGALWHRGRLRLYFFLAWAPGSGFALGLRGDQEERTGTQSCCTSVPNARAVSAPCLPPASQSPCNHRGTCDSHAPITRLFASATRCCIKPCPQAQGRCWSA